MKFNLAFESLMQIMAWALFVSSLGLIAVELDFSQEGISLYHEKHRGIELLLGGWIEVIRGQFGWFANPLLLTGLIVLRRAPKLALNLGISGLMVALTSFKRHTYWIDDHFEPTVSVWGWGCYLWLLSFVALIYGAAHLYFKK